MHFVESSLLDSYTEHEQKLRNGGCNNEYILTTLLVRTGLGTLLVQQERQVVALLPQTPLPTLQPVNMQAVQPIPQEE